MLEPVSLKSRVHSRKVRDHFLLFFSKYPVIYYCFINEVCQRQLSEQCKLEENKNACTKLTRNPTEKD